MLSPDAMKNELNVHRSESTYEAPIRIYSSQYVGGS